MSDKTNSLHDFRGGKSSRDDGKASPPLGHSSTFRFATFNILHGKTPNGRVDLVAYASSIAELNAEVIGLQEVDKSMFRSWFSDLARVAARASGMHYAFSPVRRRYDGGLYGNALLSSGKLEELRHVKLPRKGWRRERRGAVLATVELGGQSWRIATAHLSLYRDESESQLRPLLGELAKHSGPAVVMGDFNRRPNEVAPIIEELGWNMLTTQPTYPSWKPEICLDYVVVKGAAAIDFEVQQLAVSDHRSLTVTVKFNG